MNIRDPDRDVDDLLGDHAGKIGNLYRRLPRYEPPRRLDRAVLSEAARAVHSGRPPRRQRWIFGIGSAAGIVLAAGIAWRIGHDAMNQNEAVLPSAAPVVVPVQPISESARAKREEGSATKAAAPLEKDASSDEPASERTDANRSSADEIKQSVRKAVPSNRPPPASVAAPEPLKPAVPPPARSAPEAFPDAAQQREQTQNLEKSSAGRIAPVTGGAPSGLTEQKHAATGAARQLSSPTPPSGSAELQRDMQLAPEDWLAHIRQLVEQGRRQQAAESLRLFQRAHPDWSIPEELRPLLD